MFSVNKIFMGELEIKKSKFVSYICPISQMSALQAKIAEEHKKANHLVFAYRYLNEFDQIVENQSDNGEPKGSSGPPTLDVLRGKDLVNCAILTVRYFGGIKLGIGGLVRAYGGAANEAINNAKLIEFEKKYSTKIFIPFSSIGKIEHFLNKENLENNKNFTNEGCEFEVFFTKSKENLLKEFCESQRNFGLRYL